MSNNLREKKIVEARRGTGEPVAQPLLQTGVIPELMAQQQGVAKRIVEAAGDQRKTEERLMARLDKIEALLGDLATTLAALTTLVETTSKGVRSPSI